MKIGPQKEPVEPEKPIVWRCCGVANFAHWETCCRCGNLQQPKMGKA